MDVSQIVDLPEGALNASIEVRVKCDGMNEKGQIFTFPVRPGEITIRISANQDK
jgi:hypothetical protein